MWLRYHNLWAECVWAAEGRQGAAAAWSRVIGGLPPYNYCSVFGRSVGRSVVRSFVRASRWEAGANKHVAKHAQMLANSGGSKNSLAARKRPSRKVPSYAGAAFEERKTNYIQFGNSRVTVVPRAKVCPWHLRAGVQGDKSGRGQTLDSGPQLVEVT